MARLKSTDSGTALGPTDIVVSADVRQLRMGQGLSAQGLADRVTNGGGVVDRQIISKIECGKRRVTVDGLVSLARALSVEPVDLLAELPECGACRNQPPMGFKCRICGAEG